MKSSLKIGVDLSAHSCDMRVQRLSQMYMDIRIYTSPFNGKLEVGYVTGILLAGLPCTSEITFPAAGIDHNKLPCWTRNSNPCFYIHMTDNHFSQRAGRIKEVSSALMRSLHAVYERAAKQILTLFIFENIFAKFCLFYWVFARERNLMCRWFF